MEFYRHLRQNVPVNLETEPDHHEKSFKRKTRIPSHNISFSSCLFELKTSIVLSRINVHVIVHL